MAVKQPDAYFDRASLALSLMPGQSGTILRETFYNVACAQWSRTRGVYRFDPTLAEAVTGSSIEGLHDSVFLRLPEFGVFIHVEQEVHGGWLHGGYVACVPRNGYFTLVLGSVCASDDPREPYLYGGAGLNIYPDTSLSFRDRDRLGAAQVASIGRGPHVLAQFAKHDEYLLLLAAYLCSEQPDIKNPRDPRAQPARQKRDGPVQQWDVGMRFGAAFRKQLSDAKAESAGIRPREGNRPRVHVRRAHWHTVLSGPRDQERIRESRWFPPVVVNGDGQDFPVVVWRKSNEAA